MKKNEKIELALGLGISVLSVGVYVWDLLERKKELKKQTELLKKISENKCSCHCSQKKLFIELPKRKNFHRPN